MCTNQIGFAVVLVAAVLAGPRIVSTGSPIVGAERAPASEIATVAPQPGAPDGITPETSSTVEATLAATLLEGYLESSPVWAWIRTAAGSLEEFVREAADFVGIDWPQRNMARRCS